MTLKKKVWISWVLEAVVILFLSFDVIIHIINPSFVGQAMQHLGWNPDLAPVIGIIELICLVLYIIPRTSILGAVLLTGYLGGAVAVNLGAGLSLFGYILSPVYVGVFLWGALWLRDQRLHTAIS